MPKWTFPLKWFLFSISYLSLAFLCLETRDNGSLSSTIWLPAGLTLGILCSTPLLQWPIWILSAGMLHILASLLHQRPLDIALVFALNDLVILCLSAYIWQSVRNSSAQLSNMLAMGGFIIIVLAASALGGMTTFYSLRILGYPAVLSHFLSWSISNATGCLAITPLFVVNQLIQQSTNSRTGWNHHLQIAAIIALSAALFLQNGIYLTDLPVMDFLLYLLFGLTLLSSLFIKERQLSLLYVTQALIVSIATLYNRGPYSIAIYPGNSGITASQLYLLALFISGMLVRSRVTDVLFAKKHSEQQYRLAQAVTPGQSHFQFQININQQKVIWHDPIDKLLNLPERFVATPALLLGRMHAEDREFFLPWFNGEQQTTASPYTHPVRLILTGVTFCDGQIALFSDHDNTANLYLNGLLIVYQDQLNLC